MRIAVAGCVHGHFRLLHEKLEKAHKNDPIDLILICGDLHTPRPGNTSDIESIVANPKYKADLHKFAQEYDDIFFKGNGFFNIPTLFIGGNHEAYALLSKLPYGGYVAPNLLYAGRSNIICYQGSCF